MTRRDVLAGLVGAVLGVGVGVGAMAMRGEGRPVAAGGTQVARAEIVLTTVPLSDGAASVSGARDGVWHGTYVFGERGHVREARIRAEAAVMAYQLELSQRTQE